MLNEDLRKVQTFVKETIKPLNDEVKELQQSVREEISDYCKKNQIEKKDFNEAYRRAFKDVGDEVDVLALAMAGEVPETPRLEE